MIEGSQIDSEGHANNAEGILAETRDFERAVGAAMDFADTHPGTLVVVTADHETSGLSITSNKTDFTLSSSARPDIPVRWCPFTCTARAPTGSTGSWTTPTCRKKSQR